MMRISHTCQRACRTALFAAVAGAALCFSLFVFAGDIPPAKLEQVFLEASRAYDQGRLTDAVSLYKDLVQQGYRSKELFYNLGNAYFRDGKPGLAVLNYRRAWYLAPTDPDILANLRFALQSSGGLAPSFPAGIGALLKLSLDHWIITALAAYWLTAGGAALLILFPGRKALWRATVVWAVLLCISLGGILAWADLARRPEMVILESKQEALFAPLEGSTAHFALPEGSIVRVLESSGDWIKVASGRASGWVRRSACAAANPRAHDMVLGAAAPMR